MTHTHVCYVTTHRRSLATPAGRSIFLASFAVFLFLNVFENVLHYSIGRRHSLAQHSTTTTATTTTTTTTPTITTPTTTTPTTKQSIAWPDARDWLRIACIMVLFAALQGVATLLFVKW